MASWNKGQQTTPDNPGDSQLMRWIAEHRNYTGEACLTWPFSHDGRGYGHVGRGGKNIKIHRLMCELRHGPAPSPDYHAAHSCGKGHEGCVNPQHLSWKTASENHKESIRHPKYILNPAQVKEIRALKGIEAAREVALRYGVNERTIRKIFSGETWKTDGYSRGGFKPGDPRNPFRRHGSAA